MRIAIGGDHRGRELKAKVMAELEAGGYGCRDCGCFGEAAADYPDIAREVAGAVRSGDCGFGILICLTGIGMSMVANKFPGIRAGLCRDEPDAALTRQHNDANVLCLAAGREYPDLRQLLETFLTTPFEGGRHARRLEKVRAIELEAGADG